MAYARSRSMTADLNEGLTDGAYKKVVRDRGGVVDPATYDARHDLKDVWYGIHEEPVKRRPDGKHVATPNAVWTGGAEPTV